LAQVDDVAVQARFHTGDGGSYLWAVNPGRAPRSATVTLDPGRAGAFRKATELWQSGTPVITVTGNAVRLTVQDRNAAVIRLES